MPGTRYHRQWLSLQVSVSPHCLSMCLCARYSIDLGGYIWNVLLESFIYFYQIFCFCFYKVVADLRVFALITSSTMSTAAKVNALNLKAEDGWFELWLRPVTRNFLCPPINRSVSCFFVVFFLDGWRWECHTAHVDIRMLKHIYWNLLVAGMHLPVISKQSRPLHRQK